MLQTQHTRQGVAGIVEVPALDPDDPLTPALDAAYWKLARGEEGAQDEITAIEAQIAERKAKNQRAEVMALSAARHEARLLEQKRLEDAAAARQRSQAAEAVLNPLWAEFDSLARDLAKVANHIMEVSISEQNRSPHSVVTERLRMALLANTDGAIRTRLLMELGMPHASNRSIA